MSMNAWAHAIENLLTLGHTDFDFHKWKDAPSETLGTSHRIERHDWYQAYGDLWDMSDPFPHWLKTATSDIREMLGPDKAEEVISDVGHDYFDKAFDGLFEEERKYWEGFFAWVIHRPDVIREKFGVDVRHGKVHRIIEGQEIWEDCPLVIEEYRRLRRYVTVVLRNDELLRHMLQQYGR